MGQKRLAEFVNTKTKINVKHIETFKKFLSLLKSVSESSAIGNFLLLIMYNLTILLNHYIKFICINTNLTYIKIKCNIN